MNSTHRFYALVAAFCSLLFFSASAATQEAPRQTMALLPLAANANRDISHLQTGIRSMLASRLASETNVRMINASQIDQSANAVANRDQATALAATLHADYVLACTLTAIGKAMSLDAKLYPADSGKPMESFYATAVSEDEIITAVDTLVQDIAVKSFGKQPPPPAFAAPAAPMVPQPSVAPVQQPAAVPPALPSGQTQSASPAYTTAHPDRQFIAQGGVGPAPIMFPTTISGPFGFTKTQNLNFAMQALDVADIDGDGGLDVAIADKNKVTVYHLVNNRLVPFGELSMLSRYKIFAVNLADLNGNGKAELYVTGADWITPNSLGAEWNGSAFNSLFENERWYVRPLDIPGPGKVLAGQRGAIDAPYTQGIFRVAVNDSILQQAEKLPLPPSINLYDFSMADLDGDGKSEIIALNDSDKLLVLQVGGKQLWKSDDTFGGTLRYVGGEKPNAQTSKDILETRVKDREYIHARIIVTDLNNDHQPDIIINKNLSTASRVLENMKNYPSGEIHALAWNGIGLTELWRTSKIDGYVASYQFINDPDKKTTALFVGTVLNSGWSDIFSAKDSTMLIYPLDLSKMQKQMENVPQGYQYMNK